jgi:Family of unknown function (DUF6011)
MRPDDLDDDISALFGGGGAVTPRAPVTPPAHYRPPEYTEGCPKCHGTGQTRWGTCYRCQGKGGKSFKTSPQQRARNREQAADRKAAKREAWAEENKAVVAWINQAATRAKPFEFAVSLRESLAKYGSLTDNQLAAVERLMARDKERAEQRAATVQAATSVIDVSKIEAAFERARSDAYKAGAEGVKWLRLRLDTFEFLDMPARGQYRAAIRVTEGDAKLGRIEAGKFTRFNSCSDEQLTRILAAAADPEAAAKAYGLRFSSCSCCGLELTNPLSIELGIGPICRAKWFAG